MSDLFIISSAIISIIAIVFLILKLKVDPVMSLVLGSLALVLANGKGPQAAIDAVINGFGNIMLEIGLIIGFGVLAGTILTYMGGINKLGALLLRKFGTKAMPQAFGLTIGTLLASLYIDVCLVLTAPLAKATAADLGKNGLPKMASAVMTGLIVGLTMTVPGVAALALSALLGVPLGSMLLFGVPVACATIATTIAAMNILFKFGLWKPSMDETDAWLRVRALEQRIEELDPAESLTGSSSLHQSGPTSSSNENSRAATALPEQVDAHGTILLNEDRQPPLWLSLGPLLIGLGLIAAGSISEVLGFESEEFKFLSNPTIALLIVLLGTWAVCRVRAGHAATAQALSRGFQESGSILLVTGVGGCLAAAVQTIGLGDILTKYFSPGSFAPLLVVWGIAAVLHIAIGSVTTSAITAAGILAPIVEPLGVNPVLIALAAASGSMLLIHVTSNTFWLMQTVFGISTRGAFKVYTLPVSIAAFAGLAWVLVLSIFI
ncbi:GntP family permease [Glutamicibacter sp. JL.03c]|uniref:GntP family permease n=1 Tax=Glutamicibacter sp. JL.03c TaxID=2984842 RepID=UPI0021F7B0CC|nr:GntP family permease [Glutamicibacter sp. JL.03c]UYQ77749.1 GntP family permease [Glutamicibacter sp. JL.03c]